MLNNRFDALTRHLAAHRSRRNLATLLIRMVLASPLPLLARAGAEGKKKRKKKRKQRPDAQSPPPLPPTPSPPPPLCFPEPLAATCAPGCGTRTNACGQTVFCACASFQSCLGNGGCARPCEGLSGCSETCPDCGFANTDGKQF